MTSLAEQLRGRRVGLALASGFFGFYHHAGVLAALVARGVRPARVTGNSAGALVGAMYAAGLEPDAIADELCAVERRDFWDAGWPFSARGFGLLAGERFGARLGRILPAHSFAACRVPLAVGVYGIDDGRVRHVDTGALIQAVRASCAVPYMFQPVEIGGRRFWDGGFGEKTPLAPFVKAGDLDAVVVSYLPPRDAPRDGKRRGILSFLPPPSSLLADTPRDERVERDRAAVALLRAAGVRVLVLAPETIRLGPFSMARAAAAVERGRAGAGALLDAEDESALGAPELS